jgi:PAS domain S-box-containing protein
MIKVRSGTNYLDWQTVGADVLALLPVPAFCLDDTGAIVDSNPALSQMTGIDADVLKSRNFLEFAALEEVEKDRIKNQYYAKMASGLDFSFECYAPLISGRGFWAIIQARVTTNEKQKYCLVTLTDISAQKKAFQEISQTPENSKNNFDNANDLVQSISPDGRILYANQKWLNTLGYQESELVELRLINILREDQVSHCMAIMERVKKGEIFEFVDTVFITRDGREVLVEGNITSRFENGRFIATEGIFRDVTYKRNLEETYTLLTKNSPTAMYVVQNGIFKFVNDSFSNLTGYKENELLEKESMSLVYSPDKNLVLRCATASLKARRSSNYEFRLITKSDEIRWVIESLISIPFEGRRAALGTMVDITQHKMIEKALEDAHLRYQTLFNSAGDAIYIHSQDGRILEVNDAMCKLLGYNRQHLLKTRLSDICFSNYREDLINTSDLSEVFITETNLKSRPGKLIPVEIHAKAVNYDNKKAILVVARDITARQQVEALRLKNQARSESILKIAEYAMHNAQGLLYFALEEMIKLADSRFGVFYAYDNETRELKLRALTKETYKYLAPGKRKYSYKLEQTGILGESIRQKKPVIIMTKQIPDLAANGFPEGRYKIDNYLTVPIWRNNQIIGVAGVANKDQSYDSTDVQQITLLINSMWNILQRMEVEKTLADSEQRYRQLVDLSQDGILRLDIEGKVITANPAATSIFGYTESELVGHSLTMTMTPEYLADNPHPWENIDRDNPMRFERTAMHKDGSRFPLEVSVSPLTSGYFQEVVRDISERQKMECQLQENEKKYRQIVDNQSDLISELSPEGTLKYLNPAYLKLLGKTLDELLGVSVNNLIHPDDRERGGREVRAAYSLPYSAYTESRMVTRLGWRWIAWNVNGIRDENGKVISMTCIGRDITESKLAKEELEQANLRLRELDKLKDNFLSTVSHELRTPLTSIKSFSEILLSYDEDPQTQKEFLGIISNESDRLTRLINDFLDISKIQAGRMQWKTQPVLLQEVINQVVLVARPMIESEKLNLTVEIAEDLPPVMCDKDRLIQVVTNLLNNAVKFTHEGGTITVKAYLDKPADSKSPITVSIRDSGIGIAPENHQKIFENFGQVGDVLKDRPRGTGLGLPICKKILEHFGGKIWVDSVLGQGSTFSFTLPKGGEMTETQDGHQ